jgi:hypothetical protein
MVSRFPCWEARADPWLRSASPRPPAPLAARELRLLINALNDQAARIAQVYEQLHDAEDEGWRQAGAVDNTPEDGSGDAVRAGDGTPAAQVLGSGALAAPGTNENPSSVHTQESLRARSVPKPLQRPRP